MQLSGKVLLWMILVGNHKIISLMELKKLLGSLYLNLSLILTRRFERA